MICANCRKNSFINLDKTWTQTGSDKRSNWAPYNSIEGYCPSCSYTSKKKVNENTKEDYIQMAKCNTYSNINKTWTKQKPYSI